VRQHTFNVEKAAYLLECSISVKKGNIYLLRKDNISVKKGQHISVKERTTYQSRRKATYQSRKGQHISQERQRISLLGEVAYQSCKGQQSNTQAAHGIFHSVGQ
jgi:hypothetical protein